MKILGFNFTKISAEKYKDAAIKDLKIENSIDISDISEVKQDVLKADDEFLAIKFKYTVTYNPEVAKIELLGNILASVDSKMAKEVVKKWKAKETPEEFRIPLFNTIFRKSGIKALGLEDEMNRPFHIQMPSLRRKEADD